MGAVNDPHPFRDIINIVNENRAFFGQLIDHKPVVHNLLANVNGGAKSIEGNIHHVNSAHHAGTKTTRLEKEDPFAWGYLGTSHKNQYTVPALICLRDTAFHRSSTCQPPAILRRTAFRVPHLLFSLAASLQHLLCVPKRGVG